jgi:hypothetical protein
MAQAQAQDDHRDHQRAVFRSVARGGRVGAAALSPYPASLVIKRRIAAIGLDPATYSGHSLRSGFLTSAGRGGGVAVQADRGEPPQVAGHAARLCPAG